MEINEHLQTSERRIVRSTGIGYMELGANEQERWINLFVEDGSKSVESGVWGILGSR